MAAGAVDVAAATATLKAALAVDAVARDRVGGTAKAQRDLIRRSGLLRLAVPTRFGGLGADWPETLGTVRELAQVDSALAHLYAFQHLQVGSVLLYGGPAQQEKLLTATAQGPLFWGNALNPLDRRTQLTRDDGGWRLSGAKSFCSGAADSDLLLISADDPDGQFRVAAIPTGRAGVTVLDDWDNMGQRQTDSGSVTFERVWVADDELLAPGPGASPRASLRACLAQSILATIYLGIAQGAAAEAKEFTLTESRAWRSAGVATAAEDPYVLRHYGEFQLGLAAAEALSAQALTALQAAWDRGDALTAAERGSVAVAVTLFKAAAARAGLDLTSRLFDVTGARATAARYGFDRFWRNLRTHTLHDPLDYKLKELGAWALTGAFPEPGFYA